MSEILAIGSLAYDSIHTPEGDAPRTLGGSVNYFALAASMFTKIKVIGVVGEDYEDSDIKLLIDKGVDVSGIQKQSGKTFHWEGKYEGDLNEAITMETQLNVFEHFDPVLPESHKDVPVVFLANIDPSLQLKVLEQMKSPKVVALDTMNLWINTQKDKVLDIVKKSDVLLINEGEAQMLTGEANAIAAAKTLVSYGLTAAVIKRGEYGFVLYSNDQYFILPAFPIARVVDPTGAGDSFAGGFIGYIAQHESPLDFEHLKKAGLHGTVMASFTVQDFGVKSIASVDKAKFEQRMIEYRKVIDCR